MSFIQSLAQRLARLNAAITLLQDHVTSSGVTVFEQKIINKFEAFGLDSTQAVLDFDFAKASTFERIELEQIGGTKEEFAIATEDESAKWERFRGSYE